MPVHDWSRVESGIFHDFHHAWIEELKRSLNKILPPNYYALAEQFVPKFGPDVLTLQDQTREGEAAEAWTPHWPSSGNGGTVVLAPPDIAATAETDMEFYLRKQNSVVVRHVSDDRVVAVIEVVSHANKANAVGIEGFARKSTSLLGSGVHLLILDLQPPTPRDPQGIHGVLWERISGDDTYQRPADKPLTLAAYEADLATRAYVVPVAVGDTLRDMPVFLEPQGQIPAPLEATYQRAIEAMPRRWRDVLEHEEDK